MKELDKFIIADYIEWLDSLQIVGKVDPIIRNNFINYIKRNLVDTSNSVLADMRTILKVKRNESIRLRAKEVMEKSDAYDTISTLSDIYKYLLSQKKSTDSIKNQINDSSLPK